MKRRWIPWLILFGGILLCRVSFLDNVVYNIDESEYGVTARGIDHGLLPGVDFLGSNKTPGIFFLYNLLFHIFGQSFAVTRLAYVAMLILEGGILVELAISLWGSAAAIPAAVLFWMAANGFDTPADMIPLNSEGPAMLTAVLAIWLAWWKPRGVRALIGAGLALGLSVIFRQSSGFFAIPVLTAVLLAPEQRVKRFLYFAAGGIAAWLPVLIIYGLHHGLGWAWDSWVRYPIEYAGDTGMGGFMARLAFMTGEFAFSLMVPVALAAGGAPLIVRDGKMRPIVLLSSLFIGSVLALFTGSRFFGHYWVQMFPIVALLGVPAWLYLAAHPGKKRILLTCGIGVAALFTVLHYNTWRSWDKYAEPRGVSFFHLTKANLEVTLAQYLREHTTPDDRVCVWGYCPQILWYADRLPGVRDFICHYIVGYSPGVSNLVAGRSDRTSGHPQAEEMFMADLERTRCKYIFDLSPVTDYTFSFCYYPMSVCPKLAAYVRQNYKLDCIIGGVQVYRRMADGEMPASKTAFDSVIP